MKKILTEKLLTDVLQNYLIILTGTNAIKKLCYLLDSLKINVYIFN